MRVSLRQKAVGTMLPTLHMDSNGTFTGLRAISGPARRRSAGEQDPVKSFCFVLNL